MAEVQSQRIIRCMVCGEIRKKFGVPVESMKFVMDFMNQEGANHLQAAASLMGVLGVPVMLLTDLKMTFVMDSVLEFIDLMQNGYFSGDDSESYILIKVNPLVNKLLSCMKTPINIPMHGKGYEIIHMLSKMNRANTIEEQQILILVRDQSYSRIEIELLDGEVKMLYAVKEKKAGVSELSEEEISDLIKSHKYQKVELVEQDGNVIRVKQRISIKPDVELQTSSSKTE